MVAGLTVLQQGAHSQQIFTHFGVRRALGASTGDVFRLVLVGALRITLAGAVIGLALSVVVSRLLTTVLFGVEPLDLLTFALVVIVLALTAAVSVVGPAWRATRIDPVVALRAD